MNETDMLNRRSLLKRCAAFAATLFFISKTPWRAASAPTAAAEPIEMKEMPKHIELHGVWRFPH